MSFSASFPLLFNRSWNRRDPESCLKSVAADTVVAEYRRLVWNAPKRPPEKQYFVGHTGFPSSEAASNRREEHIALALVNAQQRWPLPDGTTFELLDYQVPLKSRQADEGIGKIDLLGLSEAGRLVVVELKVTGHSGGAGDPPPTALMEALRYGAIVEANQPRIASEVSARFGRPVSGERPLLLVLGERSWWQSWAQWGQPVSALASEIGAALRLDILFGSLDECEICYGLKDVAPCLKTMPSISYTGSRLPERVVTSAYADELSARWWAYAKENVEAQLDGVKRPGRPPVLRPEDQNLNLILPPCARTAAALTEAIAPEQRHRHFGSFRSSQALAQSVFGGLAATGRLDVLATIPAECGRPAFMDGRRIGFEVNVMSLSEPRPTSLDVLLEGEGYRVAVECKFTETQFGTCSRTEGETPVCDGSYARQQGRTSRCALTEAGITYWRHAADVFSWPHEEDIGDCPLRSTYQVARNAFAVTAEGAGHAVVVYDARNPAYGPRGTADNQWRAATAACRLPGLLRRVSWQRIVTTIAGEPDLDWLVEGLARKHGIAPEAVLRKGPLSASHPTASQMQRMPSGRSER